MTMIKAIEKKTTVSVLIPSYNHSEYIRDAIDSVLSEAGGDLYIQLIVVDDCSVDGTDEVIADLLKKYTFEYYKNEQNLGVSGTLVRAMSFVKGDYIRVLASDDFLLPLQLAKQINLIEATGVDVVYAKGRVCDFNRVFLYDQDLNEFSLLLEKSQNLAFELIAIDDTCGPLLQSAVLRASVMSDVIPLWRYYKSDDWVIALHLLRFKKVLFLDEFVFGYRLHDKNSHKNSWKMFNVRLEVLCNYLAPIDVVLFRKSMANLFASQGAQLFRRGENGISVSFFLASFCFGLPLRKINVFFKRLIHVKRSNV